MNIATTVTTPAAGTTTKLRGPWRQRALDGAVLHEGHTAATITIATDGTWTVTSEDGNSDSFAPDDPARYRAALVAVLPPLATA